MVFLFGLCWYLQGLKASKKKEGGKPSNWFWFVVVKV